MHTAAFLPLAVLPLALAATYNVKVGVNKDGIQGPYYSPDKLTPAKGDSVVFEFTSNEHSVAQSSFDKPCEYLENGIFSGFPGPGKTFTITVNSTDPIWLYCSQQGHCKSGQALVLNEPKDKTLSAYKTAAQDTDGDESIDEDTKPLGGNVGDAADTTASATNSGTAKSTGGSTATSGRSDASVSASASATSASRTSAAAASSTSASPAATSSGAAGKFTVGAGLGAMGLLGFLVGGMI